LVHPGTIEAIKLNHSLSEIHQLWQKEIEDFKTVRAKYLMY
jgi:uncharacterized protein YbbC (DUF1343 family)